MSFDALNLPAPLLRALADLGFESPTPVQAEVIPAVAEGKDVVVSAKTGSGKTAAFLLPVLSAILARPDPNCGARALVLVPTRELALQIQSMFEQLARFTPVKSACVIGGEAFKHQVASLRRNPECLIATPGRLVEHLEKNSTDLNDLEFLVLDEADRMLDMGFAEELYAIMQRCRSEKQSLLFSATFNHRGFSRVRSGLRDPLHLEIDHFRQINESIEHLKMLADDETHKLALTEALVLGMEDEAKAFVFCNTRLQAQQVSNRLRAKGVRSEYLHGEIAQSDRKQVLARFRDGKIRALIATDVAARGMDVEGTDLVVNFNVPFKGEDYVHRTGRTGRAGVQGRAVTLVDANEWNRAAGIERYLNFRMGVQALEGLEAQYKGPKKLKKSGKAASKTKRKKHASAAKGRKATKPSVARSGSSVESKSKGKGQQYRPLKPRRD